MLVQSLTKKGSRVHIIFDDTSKISINYNVAVDSRLRKNDDVSDQFIQELITKNEHYEIKESAFRLLSNRLHSANELKIKLLKKNFNKAQIEIIIQELLTKKYLNDVEFTRKYIEEKLEKRDGLNKIKKGLAGKGVNREIIEEEISKIVNNPINLSNARFIAHKKIKFLSNKKLTSFQLKQKIYTHLMGKGFPNDVIREIINELNLE